MVELMKNFINSLNYATSTTHVSKIAIMTQSVKHVELFVWLFDRLNEACFKSTLCEPLSIPSFSLTVITAKCFSHLSLILPANPVSFPLLKPCRINLSQKATKIYSKWQSLENARKYFSTPVGTRFSIYCKDMMKKSQWILRWGLIGEWLG